MNEFTPPIQEFSSSVAYRVPHILKSGLSHDRLESLTWRHLLIRDDPGAGQCPMATWAEVSAAAADRAVTLMPQSVSGCVSFRYSAATVAEQGDPNRRYVAAGLFSMG